MNKYSILLLLTSVALCGCSDKIKRKVGMVSAGPNEYAVDKYQPLEIPPHYDLPEPNSISE